MGLHAIQPNRAAPSGRRGILALDLGTSSARACRFDQRARRVAGSLVSHTYPLACGDDGRAELDPRHLLSTMQELLRQRDDRTAVVATSCFWHGLLGTDATGRPLTPIYTWADSRCSADAATLREELDERAVHRRTGCMLRASFWPAKLRWLRRTQPRLFRSVARWVGPGEWLWWRLTGTLRVAHGMATGTGLYDPQRLTWDRALLRHMGVTSDHLPEIGDQPLDWRGLTVMPAIGDGAANNLGVGATTAGSAAINVGTSAAIRIVRDHGPARAPFGLFCYRIDQQRFVIGGAVSNAGNLRAWCIDRLRLPDAPTLEQELARRSGPHPHLTVLPFWLGERAPTWRDDLSGAIVGIRNSTTAVDLLQAITEAGYQRLAQIRELIPVTGPLTLRVAGGIQQSPAAMQRLADCLGRPLIAVDEAESGLRGAAVLALERLGMPVPPITGRRVRPRAAAAAAYARHRQRLATLEQALYPGGHP